MFKIDNIIRQNIRNLKPYSCARDEYNSDKGTFLDANENPFGILNRYPDPYQMELKRAISRLKNISVENVFLGNGSDEVIDLVYRIFCNPSKDKALIFTPTYGMYEVSANLNDIELIKVPLTDSFQIDLEKTKPYLSDKLLKVIFICSPNNPTGNSLDVDSIKKIANLFRGIVIVDEAYIDFAAQNSLLSSISEIPNLIVMQTLSKAYGLAGVRIGMAFGSKSIIQIFNKVKAPYNISTLNQRIAIEKLMESEVTKNEIDFLKSERDRVAKKLENLMVVKRIYPSDSNFLLLEVSNADKTYQYLVNKGIIVRNRNSVIQNCIRITIGQTEENNHLIKTLEEMI